MPSGLLLRLLRDGSLLSSAGQGERSGVQACAAASSVGDLLQAGADSVSVASWKRMGFTGGPALFCVAMTKYGLVRDFGSVPRTIHPSVLDPACEADGFGRTIALDCHSSSVAASVSWGV